MRILTCGVSIINLDHLIAVEYRGPTFDDDKPAILLHLSNGHNLEVEAADVILTNLFKTLENKLPDSERHVVIDLDHEIEVHTEKK